MKAIRAFIWVLLLVSATSFAADGKAKRLEVEPVDVPEKAVVQPTPEEIHQESITRTCVSCHFQGDLEAEPKPLNHFLTTKDCGACHFNKSWVPLRFYSHLSGRYKPNSTPEDCLSCHKSNSEFLVR
jgi:nitrate/TMAO reductase-like tetraheme cytochrome c subunit